MSDHYDRYNGMEELLGTNLAEVGTDCISRQAAIDALAEDMPSAYTPDGSHPADEGIFMAQEIYADCIQTLKELPSAEPKRGKWILDRSGAYCCSECMEPCAGYVMMRPRDKFCKMCGSRNEVTE